MNYPLRKAILAFVLEGDAEGLYNTVTELYSSYPSFVCDALMNLLGTHDTARIVSVLSGQPLEEMSNRELAHFRLDKVERERAVTRLKIASVLQFTMPGVPSVYYGDEAGGEGGHDPFCRMPYPWGREEKDLVAHYHFLGKLRREHTVFKHGELRFLERRTHFVAYTREDERERLLVLANSGEREEPFFLNSECVDAVTGEKIVGWLTVSPISVRILVELTPS